MTDLEALQSLFRPCCKFCVRGNRPANARAAVTPSQTGLMEDISAPRS